MDKANTKFTILYARLSQEDGQNGISNSIENQRMILEKYAEEHDFYNCKFMFDDGVSGTTLNRPAFNEVMQLIEAGKVGILIVKDTSRVGRNYIRVGELIDEILPSFGVRFISVNDNADSLYGLDDFMPFRAVMHDHYAKETSKKIRAVKKAKAERGERIGGKPPYGYVKDEQRKNKLKPDPYSANIVRKIFKLCIEGRGPKQIAMQLEQELVLNPSNYHYRQTGIELLNLNTDKPYHWSHKTVSRIIEDEVYLGHVINMRTYVQSYKNSKKIDKPKEEWIKVENTHEPIVSQEVFDMAQRVRQQKNVYPKAMEHRIFSQGCCSAQTVERC